MKIVVLKGTKFHIVKYKQPDLEKYGYTLKYAEGIAKGNKYLVDMGTAIWNKTMSGLIKQYNSIVK